MVRAGSKHLDNARGHDHNPDARHRAVTHAATADPATSGVGEMRGPAMRSSGLPRRLSALSVVAVLVIGLGSGSSAVLGASGNPPRILFAGELLSAPAYDHVVLVYNTRLDQTVPIPLADFTVTIDGTPHAPAGATYLLSGLAGSGDPFDASGTTFIQLDLPAGVVISPLSAFTVTHAPGAAPIRDLSLTAAVAETFTGEVVDGGTFSFLAAIVDAGNATDRLTLLFIGQVDLGSVPAPTDFEVDVNGAPVYVVGVDTRVPEIGLGIVDLVLETPVRNGDAVDVAYAPGATPLTARNGGLVLDPFSSLGIPIFAPPTSASAVIAAGETVATGSGDPPAPADPLTTAVTSPNAGLVTIDETATDPAPPGYTFFGEQVEVTAPPASSASDPLVLVFEIDATLVPAGEDEASIVVLRNGVPIADCNGDPGEAVPAPCVAERLAIGDGDLRITVYTVAASRWNLAVVSPYAFGGFRSPVDGAGVRNLAKAGSAIPVKFSLGGDRGTSIFTAGSPASQRVTCDTSAALDAIEETVAAGGSSLSYRAGTDVYTYTWKTDGTWAGTCRSLVLSFGDGSQQSALFQFR